MYPLQKATSSIVAQGPSSHSKW